MTNPDKGVKSEYYYKIMFPVTDLFKWHKILNNCSTSQNYDLWYNVIQVTAIKP